MQIGSYANINILKNQEPCLLQHFYDVNTETMLKIEKYKQLR